MHQDQALRIEVSGVRKSCKMSAINSFGFCSFFCCKSVISDNLAAISLNAYQCFKRLIVKRKKLRIEPIVDGKSCFLILDKNNMPYLANHWEKRFQYSLGKYNRRYKEELPKITPHVCRHTYCTNMAKSGVSPKTLQYLMGHSDIATTLGIYTHLKYEDAEREMKELEEKNKTVS